MPTATTAAIRLLENRDPYGRTYQLQRRKAAIPRVLVAKFPCGTMDSRCLHTILKLILNIAVRQSRMWILFSEKARTRQKSTRCFSEAVPNQLDPGTQNPRYAAPYPMDVASG